MNTAECPQCGNEVSLGTQPKLGKLVECKECGAELEVVWLDPLELDWPLDEDELEEDEDTDDLEEEEY
jgi:alpha-aminoadipate carrier protein LysW